MLELIKGYLIKLDDNIDNEILGDAISKVDDIINFFKMNIDNKRLNLHFSTFDVAFDIALFQYLAKHYTQGKLIGMLDISQNVAQDLEGSILLFFAYKLGGLLEEDSNGKVNFGTLSSSNSFDDEATSGVGLGQNVRGGERMLEEGDDDL
jgi:hypothetical protein